MILNAFSLINSINKAFGIHAYGLNIAVYQFQIKKKNVLVLNIAEKLLAGR